MVPLTWHHAGILVSTKYHYRQRQQKSKLIKQKMSFILLSIYYFNSHAWKEKPSSHHDSRFYKYANPQMLWQIFLKKCILKHLWMFASDRTSSDHPCSVKWLVEKHFLCLASCNLIGWLYVAFRNNRTVFFSVCLEIRKCLRDAMCNIFLRNNY